MAIKRDEEFIRKICHDYEIVNALYFARNAHQGQKRKKDGKTPYVSHAINVMELLISSLKYEFVHKCEVEASSNDQIKLGTRDFEELKKKNHQLYAKFFREYKDVIIAGVLHDVVEDTHKNLPRERKLAVVRSKFGDRVADIVDLMTEWKEDGYSERKNTQQKRILDADRYAKLVKCADNISNIGETVQDVKNGDNDAWKIYKIRPTEVVNNHINTLGALQELDGNPLYAELTRIVEEATVLARNFEQEQGTEFWDKKISTKEFYSEEDAVNYFHQTYKAEKTK